MGSTLPYVPVAVAGIVGVLTALGVHRAGRGLFASLFAGVFCGILGAFGAFLLLLGGIRLIWIISYIRRERNQRSE